MVAQLCPAIPVSESRRTGYQHKCIPGAGQWRASPGGAAGWRRPVPEGTSLLHRAVPAYAPDATARTVVLVLMPLPEQHALPGEAG